MKPFRKHSPKWRSRGVSTSSSWLMWTTISWKIGTISTGCTILKSPSFTDSSLSCTAHQSKNFKHKREQTTLFSYLVKEIEFKETMLLSNLGRWQYYSFKYCCFYQVYEVQRFHFALLVTYTVKFLSQSLSFYVRLYSRWTVATAPTGGNQSIFHFALTSFINIWKSE